MKKLFFTLTLVFGFAAMNYANTYRLNEQAIENSFNAATEQTLSDSFNTGDFATLNLTGISGDEPTKTGFLLRACFCGGFGLHRSYMGTKGMFIKYCWNPIGFIDFVYVLFKGDEAFNKFKGNNKWVVWND